MKTLHKTILILLLTTCGLHAFSQSKEDIKTLISEGIALHDQGKYAEAIEKYKAALKIDPENYQASYEISFSLSAAGRPKEALPYLEKATEEKSPYRADGYDLLGNIYDDDHQSDKALEYYNAGIRAAPEYQRLRFNIAIAYYKMGKYTEAETSAIEAIRLDPKHASSQRIYAMACYKLQKRACSLLAWCSFLLLEPQSKRSPEAMAYLKNILNHGIKKGDDKTVNITVNPNIQGDVMMPIMILGATTGKKGLSPVDSLQLQLTSVFKVAHTLIGNKESSLINKYFADYFQKLGNSDNMPAFTRFVSISAYQEDNLKWFKENDQQLKALDAWVTTTDRPIN